MFHVRPRFVGVFPSQFPGWIPKGEAKHGMFPAHGMEMSVRFNPVGVSAIEESGDLWVLVHDFSAPSTPVGSNLRWVRFQVPVVEE